ncbi:DNA polymerase [Corynebacterium xerosis]|uniref:DNA-directed DNA polymerase n=1 Tax=Corynebacterium xerosis TaxID=1725 RepID=A0A6B8TRD1_9CORY|nr:DNA polymerase [Corynebacterium xerosis]QGS35291.1 DNA polymerase [Corynebacterium xerosis]
MKTLSLDVETYSGTNIARGGAYRYAADPDFELLLFAYAVDDGPVHVVSTATGEHVPDDVIDALTNPAVTKRAWNAQFERVVLSRWLHQAGRLAAGEYLDPAGWECTMVWASALGLPRALKDAGAALHLDEQKIAEGKELIQFFCVPTRGRKADAPALFDAEGLQHRNLPESAPEKWADFIEYCRRDVEVESAIRRKLDAMPLPRQVWVEYAVDQRINDRGIRIDQELAAAAIDADDTYRAHCIDEARELTGLDNPASPTQLQRWLGEQGVDVASMAKQDVADALATATGTARRVLELRQDMSRSSTKKYEAMQNVVGPDGRARGLAQFYGAGRTGRWAGRLIQVQNLPRNYLSDLDEARALVRGGHHQAVEMLYDNLPDTLSQLIRTAFIPAKGMRFIVADYSAIEARVLAWLAGEQKTLDAFAAGEDLYCVTASAMFGVPVGKHGPNADLRQKGKIAVLACGYQGGVGAMRAMGALRMGIEEHELQPIVDAWRDANTHVVDYWWRIDQAALDAIRTGRPQRVRAVTLRMRSGALTITLPSGRTLVYPGARLGTNRFGKPSVQFRGIGMNRKFQTEETYGGKLTENITQAVARDLLAHALGVVADAGHTITSHVHDEIIVEAPPETTVEEICQLMAETPDWAEGLPITADGFECAYYRKDD